MTMPIRHSLKRPIRRGRSASVIVLALILSFASETVAFNAQENPNGIRWQSSSSETWSGSAQTDGSGNRAQLAGTCDGAPDAVNPQGVTAYFGLLDPIRAPVTVTPTPSPTGLSPTPTRTETPTESPTFSPTDLVPTTTATPTMPTSTATASPTLTPTEGVPTLAATPTPTMATSTATASPTLTPTTLTATPTCFITDQDYDLSGDNKVSAEDMFLLIQTIRQGTGEADFNCDGLTDATDLLLMSQKWEIEVLHTSPARTQVQGQYSH